MKKMFYFVLLFLHFIYAKPMESIDKYNVILVHGAGGHMYGMDCVNSDSVYSEANKYRPRDKNDSIIENEYLKLIGGYGRNFGDVTLNGVEFNLDSNMFGFGVDISYMKNRESSAEDMDKDGNGLRHWLTENILEDSKDKKAIYLQRPFTNPANSPINNAKELGYPKWQGDKKCSERRSLIEEAQEVRAKGRDSLINLRKSVENRNKLPPSRNILIAHSMGGVASREYVQGNDYNNDVDKVITLDSPHDGTGSLEMLLEMSDIQSRATQVATNTLTTIAATSALLAASSKDMPSATAALYSFLPILGENAITFGLGIALIKALDKHYQKEDSLTPYINPNISGGINDLKNRPYAENLPMMRLLYGTNSMTFSDPKGDKIVSNLNYLIPKMGASFFYNLYSQFSGGGSATVNFINSMAASIAGLAFGVTIGEHGTTLIPQKSGSAENTKALNDARADVMKRSFDGHITNKLGKINVDKVIESIPATVAISAAAIVAVDYVPFIPPPVAAAAKSGIAIAMCTILSADAGTAVVAGIHDLAGSHEAPLLKDFQSEQFANANKYSKLPSGDTAITPYRMEEFLYEKPFVNLRVKSILDSDWKDQNKDTLGLFRYDSVTNQYVLLGVTADFTKPNPLTFKSGSDWEQMGAKKERWSTTARGVNNEKIPIRHADRYLMPGFMVENYIEKYDFEVDDLMPHRLRQIRINFNFNEDIAWECDINKPETADDACLVYMRSSDGKGWKQIKNVKHPVNRNGIFEFRPRDFYNSVGLGAIQKDNQNTVTISTVNKIGLTNSQRFYYMFKATADLLEPVWPPRNIKVSAVKDFTAYVSTLAYQDITAMGGQECVMLDIAKKQRWQQSLARTGIHAYPRWRLRGFCECLGRGRKYVSKET